MTSTRTIKVDYLARVEGEGALYVKIENDKVLDVKLKIFEPPRFFEAFLKGRKWTDTPDITARICGICPIAYQMTAVRAMESIIGWSPSEPLNRLRRMIYCGEWIESHALHIFMLHAPDFFGLSDGIELSKKFPNEMRTALSIKKTGNEIVSFIGGREIHPINIRVGGFYKTPRTQEMADFSDKLELGLEKIESLVPWIKSFDFPEFNKDYEYVALSHPGEYPIHEGEIVSSKGIKITAPQFNGIFEEEHVQHSNALHSIIRGRGAYFVGPMARYNLNFSKFSPNVKAFAGKLGLSSTCSNPFKSLLVRVVELYFAFDEALKIARLYTQPDQAFELLLPQAGTGHAATEAPRGLIYHRYQISNDGLIEEAQIVPPTSQNQKTIEKDLFDYIPPNLGMSDEELTWKCEQAIRNYDPCISCSTHFLRMKVDRGQSQ